MNNEEAIRRLKQMEKDALHNSMGQISLDGRHIEIKLGIEALEKQVPKKPNKAIDSSWGIKKEIHVCPICDYYLTEVHFIGFHKVEENKKITFCETCGQAIDWGNHDEG